MPVPLSCGGMPSEAHLSKSEHRSAIDNEAGLLQVSVAQSLHLQRACRHLHAVQPLCRCPEDVLQIPTCSRMAVGAGSQLARCRRWTAVVYVCGEGCIQDSLLSAMWPLSAQKSWLCCSCNGTAATQGSKNTKPQEGKRCPCSKLCAAREGSPSLVEPTWGTLSCPIAEQARIARISTRPITQKCSLQLA